MRKRFLKLIILFLIFSLSKVGLTNASFVDQEISNNNLFVAGSLDFSLRSENNENLSSLFNLSDLKPGNFLVKILKVKKEGSLDFKYEARFVKTAGDDNFCQNLNLKVQQGGNVKYEGKLTNFVLAPLVIENDGEDEWEFNLSLNSGDSSLQNKNCQFNFIFRGWQLDSDGSWGYVDEEILTNSVSSQNWIEPTPTPTPTPSVLPTPTIPAKVVINEVYYDVASNQNEGNESNPDEWIELYNSGNTAVNLKNWVIADNSESTTINREVKIPAGGFAVLAKSANTWRYWNIPTDAVKIELGQKIGNGLANSGDQLILKDNNGIERDRVAWGNYIAGWNLNASEGKSIARKVKGYDTDSPSDWEVLDVPNPGTNPHSSNLNPIASFTLRSDKKAVSFRVDNIKNYKTLYYEIIYVSNGLEEGISSGSEIDLKNEDSFERNDLILGSCSGIEGKVCTYHTGITTLTLRVVLTLPNGQTTEIIKEMAY